MRPSGLLPLLHQDEGAVRAEVLRCLPGGARQGAHCSATIPRGWLLVVTARPHRPSSFIVEKSAEFEWYNLGRIHVK